MKKLFVLFLSLLLVVSVSGCSKPDKGSEEAENVAEDVVEESVEDAQETEESSVSDKEALQEEFEKNVGNGLVTFEKDVRNDATGRWRLLKYASNENIVDHAKEYYDAFFESDDEIHFVINFTLGTTTVINSSDGESLTLTVHEYYDGEEHDAKVLPGGETLKEYIYYFDNGELKELY